MLLGTFYTGVEIHREDKIVYARFLVPHRVISTCPAAGGLRDDLSFLYNHQSCEPTGHRRPVHRLCSEDPNGYRRAVCRIHGLPDEKCATLGTAANMNYAIIKRESFRDLVVVAICTGGVETNAGRAGDPAGIYEQDGRFHKVGELQAADHGTINTLLFINTELTAGAMVRSVITATEAKSAALQELAVGSRYSDGLATGTGTDQIGIAARLNTGIPLTGAGKHCTLGELIGKTVHDAVRETLMLQNHLTPDGQRSSIVHLERFGIGDDVFLERVALHLDETDSTLLRRNFTVVERDPMVVAAVAALVHLRDKIVWGILPTSSAPEIWATHGAQVAAAVSGDCSHFTAFRNILAGAGYNFSNEDMLRLVAHAFALGFGKKWIDPSPETIDP